MRVRESTIEQELVEKLGGSSTPCELTFAAVLRSKPISASISKS